MSESSVQHVWWSQASSDLAAQCKDDFNKFSGSITNVASNTLSPVCLYYYFFPPRRCRAKTLKAFQYERFPPKHRCSLICITLHSNSQWYTHTCTHILISAPAPAQGPRPGLPPCLGDDSGRWRQFRSTGDPDLLVGTLGGRVDHKNEVGVTLITLSSSPHPTLLLVYGEEKGGPGTHAMHIVCMENGSKLDGKGKQNMKLNWSEQTADKAQPAPC